MTKEKKELRISVLGINTISIISLIIGICGIITFALQKNSYPWIFLLAFSACSILLSTIFLICWIYLAVKNRKKIKIKEFLKDTYNLKEDIGQITIVQIVVTIITLIPLMLALIL